MFTLVKNQAGVGIWSEEKPTPPAPAAREVQIKVTHAGICGTDLHIYGWDEWSAQRMKLPTIIGHEFVGEITSVGDNVYDFDVGQRVSGECHITCGTCKMCRIGKANLCEKTEIFGVDRDGIFAEVVNLPAKNIWPVHEDIPNQHAAIFDPTGNAMHAVSSAPVAGKHVLVTGAGSIGLVSIAVAKARGARKVSVIEPSKVRRELAEQLGADVVLGLNDDIKAIGSAPEIVLEMSGHPDAIRTSVDVCENGGTVVLMGLSAQPVTLDLTEKVVFKGLTLKGVTGRRIFKTWYQVESFMRANPKAMDTIVSEVHSFDDFQKGFDRALSGEVAKVVLTFNK